MKPTKELNTQDHSRDSAGLRYVYPVVSRRAGGVSVGINLNPNNACNWRCVYCQVPDLKRGAAPAIDHALLESELRGFLHDLTESNFYDRFGVPDQYRRISDIALSGNGEPTSAETFPEIIDLIGSVMADFGFSDRLNLVLISNGSLIHQRRVQQGLELLSKLGGEIWFKIDSATDAGLKRINNSRVSSNRQSQNLQIGAQICRTWVQTCVFEWHGEAMSTTERHAYLRLLDRIHKLENQFKGVLLYSLARESQQPEQQWLGSAAPEWLDTFAMDLRELGIEVRVNR